MNSFQATEPEYIGRNECLYAANRIVPLVNHLAGYGISASDLLEGTGVPPAALYDPAVHISRAQVIKVFERFIEVAPSHLSALELGVNSRITDHGMYGYGLLSSATTEEAIHFALTHQQLANPIVDLSTTVVGDEASWVLEPFPELAARPRLLQFAFELQASTLLAIFRAIVGPTFSWARAEFSYSVPAGASEYELVLSCSVRFHAAKTQLIFPAEVLKRPTLGANQLTFKTVEKICDSLLQDVDASRRVTKSVFAKLLSTPGRYPSLAEFAQGLGESTDELTARLEKENTTYAALVDEIKLKLASSYLTTTELPIDAIATRLDFKDEDEFKEEFLEWTGVDVEAFREQNP